jgi:hypothetical protein
VNQANTGLVASTAGLVFGEADLIGSSVAQTLPGRGRPVRLSLDPASVDNSS